jgi:class 3 adenylate cyclase
MGTATSGSPSPAPLESRSTEHGGQALRSAARGLLADERFRVRPLGSYPLKDFDTPEPLFQLEVDRLHPRPPDLG